LNSNDVTSHDHPRNDLALAEAALFLAAQPLTRRALAKILGGVAQAYVDQLLADLKSQFEDASRGIELHVEDGRAQFRVKSAYVSEVSHLAPQHDIPRQELRTLAVIAYNHPMTQSNLIKVRGNKGYKHVQELLERNLITSEPHGRTRLLHVTRDFLRHFGLNSVDEFRFHFPTAAEENAEALARGGPSDGDSDEPQSADVEAGDNLETSSQEPVDSAPSRKPGEDQDPVDHDNERSLREPEEVGTSEPESPPIEDADEADIGESEESDEPLASKEELESTENDIEDETDEESAEE